MRSFVFSKPVNTEVISSSDETSFVLSRESEVPASVAALAAPRSFVFSGSPPRGAQGNPGPTGASGSGVIYIFKTNSAIDALSKGELVYDVDSTHMNRAISNDATKKVVMAMVNDTTVGPGASGATVISGMVTQLTAEWDTLLGTVGGLVNGATYFLDGSVAGRMTLVPPTSGWIVSVGYAVSPTDFFVRIEPSIKL